MGAAVPVESLRVVRGGRLVLPAISLAVRTGTVTGLVRAERLMTLVLGMALGLFASAFARPDFQAVQFLPATVLALALGAATLRRRTP